MLVLQGHEHRVTCAAYAPDGRTLAPGGHDGTVRLWDVAFAPDGMTIAAAGLRGAVICDVDEGVW